MMPKNVVFNVHDVNHGGFHHNRFSLTILTGRKRLESRSVIEALTLQDVSTQSCTDDLTVKLPHLRMQIPPLRPRLLHSSEEKQELFVHIPSYFSITTSFVGDVMGKHQELVQSVQSFPDRRQNKQALKVCQSSPRRFLQVKNLKTSTLYFFLQ